MRNMSKRRREALATGRRVPIQALVLRTLFITGVVSTALIAPNAMRLFKNIDRGNAKRKRLYQRIAQARSRLERKGLIQIRGSGRDTRVELTKAGARKIDAIFANDFTIPEPTFWDGKWRVIMFDVREKRKHIRNQMRHMLRAAGFVRMQDSVWIYPYPCDEFVELVRSHLKSGVGELLYLTTDAFAGDTHLRSHFNLDLK